MNTSQLLKKIKKNTGLESEREVLIEIMKSPYERMTEEEYMKICGPNYSPGTFFVSDRMHENSFLFDETQQSFEQWFNNAVSGEIMQLSKNLDFRSKVMQYGEENLIHDSYTLLFFHDEKGMILAELITNQEYSDFFRRIILFLIYGNANYEINAYKDFNDLGYKLIPKVLERGRYSLKQRLCQSIYSGLIGMDIKDELAAASPLSVENIIRLKTNDSDEEKIDRIFECLNSVALPAEINVDSWDSFEKNIVNSTTVVKVCWFTDDYIPTMFEMKFIEELLLSNSNIIMTLIPRVQPYSNDASYRDIEELLLLPIYHELRILKVNNRFNICHYGMDMGTFNGKRLSKECAHIVDECDFVVIAGARSYEMGQGINKHCYFTGIAICRTYSETVTGICKDDGAIVFVEQMAGEKSFMGFKERAWKRKYCKKHNRWFPVAGFTTREYIEDKED